MNPPASTVLRVILFTDLAGSTDMKRRLGDAEGARWIARHDALFRSCLQRHSGREDESTGDGFFATFDVPSDALRCALAFQRELANLKSPEPLRARVGVHMGEIVRVPASTVRDKYVGLAVDTAARVMSLAQPGQVLLTRHAFDSVRQQVAEVDGQSVAYLAHGPYRFQGVDDPLEVFEAGVGGLSPLTPPPDSQKAFRAIAPQDDETLGWRPAVGLAVPSRESWKLERKIGAGGFGEVWLARHERTRDVRTFKFCFDARRLRTLKRELTLFRLMREALGERPDIARLYDVRLDEPPFFLEMEYTAGGSLLDWTARQGGVELVPLDVRIDIAAQAAAALAAAHSVGVIHKDVKPANVLIHEEPPRSLGPKTAVAAHRTGRDAPHSTLDLGACRPGTLAAGFDQAGAGGLSEFPEQRCIQVRLTDFGIGELVHDDAMHQTGVTATGFDGAATQLSELGSRTGTRLYMAPERLADRPATIQSDVYALGVLLYQLVVGDLHRPLAEGWQRDLQAPLHAVTSPLDSQRHEDLVTLLIEDIAACVAGRPQERLSSAGELCERLRQLDRRVATRAEDRRREAAERLRQKIEAAEALERQEREARRRRQTQAAFLSAGLLAAVAAVAGIGYWQTERARRDKANALTRAEAAESAERARADELDQVAEFQQSQLSHIDVRSMGAQLRRDLLQSVEASAKRSGSPPDAIAAAAADLERLIAGADFTGIALRSIDENIFRRTLDAIEEQFANQPLVKARLLQAAADTLYKLGLFSRAAAPQTEALEIRRRELGNDHLDTLASVHSLALLLVGQDKQSEAELCLREALEGRRRVLGEDHPKTLTSLNDVGALLFLQGKYAEAEPFYRQALEGRRRVLGDDHPETLKSLNNMANLLMKHGKSEEAVEYYRTVIETGRQVLGDDHPETLGVVNNLGSLLIEQGRLAEAEPCYRQALEGRRRALGDLHPDTLASLYNMGYLLHSLGNRTEAELFYREALAGRRRVLGNQHQDTLLSLGNLGLLLADEGKTVEAEACFREALDASRRSLGDRHPGVAMCSFNLANVLSEKHDHAAAEPLFRDALSIIESSLPSANVHAAVYRCALGINLSRLNRREEAATLLVDAWAVLSNAPDMANMHKRQALEGLAELYENWHAAQPDGGYDVQASKWRARLAEWHTSTQPASIHAADD